MKSTGLIAVACAAALTLACGGGRDDESTRPINETEQFEGDRPAGTTGQQPEGTTGETGTGADGDARNFALQASKRGAAEIELGNLASERGQSAEVKQFAKMMVADHTKAGNELNAAVSAHGVTLSAEPPDESEELVNRLRNMRGAEFDRAYMEAMVDGHDEMKGMISGRLDDGREGTTRSPLQTAVNEWASKALPTVEQHLQQAKQIHEKLQNARNTTN